MKYNFSFYDFNQLSTLQLYDYLQLRSEVFVVEQNCVYQDLDNLDKIAFHVLVYQGEKLIACARIIPAGITYNEISIGRVIVAGHERKKNIGIQLMNFCIDKITEQFGPQTIVLSAQAHLQEFYQKLGFEAQGEGYLEDGIPHIKMLRKK